MLYADNKPDKLYTQQEKREVKLITKDTDYAVKALSCISVLKKKNVTVKNLACELGISGPFLRKILQTLNKKGILDSSKGKTGGFSMAADPDKISILDIMEIFQGPFHLNEHKIKGKTCKFLKTCLLKRSLDGIESRVREDLKTLTISQLIKRGE